jgi:hypothetical protein
MKLLLILLAGTLAACQSWQGQAADHPSPPPHRGPGTGAGASGTMGSGTASGDGHGVWNGMGKDSWYGLCALNQRITAAPTPEERQALIDQAMPNMSQEARERQLQAMRQNCQ